MQKPDRPIGVADNVGAVRYFALVFARRPVAQFNLVASGFVLYVVPNAMQIAASPAKCGCHGGVLSFVPLARRLWMSIFLARPIERRGVMPTAVGYDEALRLRPPVFAVATFARIAERA